MSGFGPKKQTQFQYSISDGLSTPFVQLHNWMEVKNFLDFFVWGLYNCQIMVLEIEPALFILKMPVFIVMKKFFWGVPGQARTNIMAMGILIAVCLIALISW